MKSVLKLRAAVLALVFGLYTLACSVFCIAQNLIFNRRDFDDFFVRWIWARPLLWIAGIRVEVRGQPPQSERGFLYLFNHSSHIDIVILMAMLNPTPRFGAKIELFKIPFFGQAMRRVGALPIARAQREKVLQIYQEAEARVAQGESFALAPEGTRQTQRQLGRFKTGPFIFAINAQMNIVPVVLAGALDLQPKGSLLINPKGWTWKVIVEICEPFSSQGLTLEDVGSLQERVRNHMAATFDRLNAELGLGLPASQVES